jgi:uncharacterized protein YdcH (DUF465 family)
MSSSTPNSQNSGNSSPDTPVTIHHLNKSLESHTKDLTSNLATLFDTKFDQLLTSFSQLRAELSTVRMNCDKAAGDASKSLEQCNVLRSEMTNLKDENLHLKSELLACKRKLNILEDQSRQCNLLFTGIKERNGESQPTLSDEISSILSKMNIPNNTIRISRQYRVGPLHTSEPRPVRVQFASVHDRDQVWKARRCLKGTSIYVNEDFSPETSDQASYQL